MMTKVGLYAVLRLGTLVQEDETLWAALFYLGLGTMISGTVGMVATNHLARLVSYSVLVSMGTLLATLGLRIDALTAPVLFYLIVSVLTTCLFFLLTGMTDRTRGLAGPAPEDEAPAQMPQPLYVAYGIKEPSTYASTDDAGVAIPAAMAFLGLVFVSCTLLITGLPPLPGFLAKFALLSIAVQAAPAASSAIPIWIFCVTVVVSGLAGLLALSRIGMRLFWSIASRHTPRLRVVEAGPVAALVLICLALTVAADPVTRYLESAAGSLHEPHTYIRAVLSGQTQREQIGEREP
jgi:multicomponent K+:H+ antiporter subunit D